jgi:Co/Zn/Cd efflux system component
LDSGITSGLIGGLVAAIISTLIIKSAQRKITHGELKHGVFILVLAMVCMTISLFAAWSFVYDDDVHEKAGELVAVIGLFSGFSVFSFVFFAEYFKARGRFNDNGIEFQTPWTGTKKENWDDLVSAKFNPSMHWYTLQFESGNKVRLSSCLLGHGEVLALLHSRGFDLSQCGEQ